MDNNDDVLTPATRDPTNELQLNLDKSKSFEDQAKDVATVVATKKAFADAGLIDDLAEAKKKELAEAAKKSLKEEQAKGKTAEKALQKGLFGIYEGLAEYMGLKRDIPGAMLKVLMCVMQPILGLIMLVVGLIAGTINIIMDAINSTVDRFGKLAEGAKRIVKSLLWIIISALVLLIAYIVLKYFGINLFDLKGGK